MGELVTVNQGAMVGPADFVPAVLSYAGHDVVKAFFTYFTDQIRNPHTRAAYHRNAVGFFEWCGERGLAFADIESFHVSAYIEQLRLKLSDASVKQHLAAIKVLFDWLLIQQVVRLNPAAAVRGPKVVVRRGKTPVMDEETAKAFFDAFAQRAGDRLLSVVELRDRAMCAVMTYALPRTSSVLAMKVSDFYPNGKTWWVRFSTAKGGKFHEMPAHHKLVEYLDAYIGAAGIAEDRKSPLFRSTRGRTGLLTDRPLSRGNAWDLVRRRAKDAGIQMDICNHTFRGTGITNYVANGGSLEKAQDMACHADPRTTRLYIRTDDKATFDEIERIRI